MELPNDQNSNTTRPSTTLFSREMFEPDTNTSQHNPLLSPPLPPFDWPPDPPHPLSSQSQQINNSHHHHQPASFPPNRLTRVLSEPNGMGASQQNQQLANSHHSLQQQNNQNHQNSNQHHPQHRNLQKDEFLIMSTHEPIQHDPSLLNTQPAHNQTQYHQPNLASEPASQADTDLLNFGPTLQQQIQRQDRELRSIRKQDQPMDIESDSQGYLFEKESHKNFEVYQEREKQWDIDNNQQDHQSQSGIEEEAMPEQNSNLFEYGFTKFKKQPDLQIGGSKNELVEHREQAVQLQESKENKQNQNIQVRQIAVQIVQIAHKQDGQPHKQQLFDTPNQFVQIPSKQNNHPHPDQSILLSSDEANLDSQLNYPSEEAKVFSQILSQSNPHQTRRESMSQQDRALLGGYYDAESNSQSQTHRQIHLQQQQVNQPQQNRVVEQQCAAERQLKQQIQTKEIANLDGVQEEQAKNRQQLATKVQQQSQPQNCSNNAQQLDLVNQQPINQHSQPTDQNIQNINPQPNHPPSNHHQQQLLSQQQYKISQEQPQQLNRQHQQQQDEVQSLRQYLQSNQPYQPSIQSITTQLKQILQQPIHQTDHQRFDQFQTIIQPHINLLFLKPIDSIGQSILQNGQLAILFAQLMVLKEPFEQERKLLLKYLLAVLSRNIKTNQSHFQNYSDSYHNRISSKFTIVDQVVSIRNSPQKHQVQEEQQSIQNYSVEVHANSIHHDPKSIIKSTKKGKINEPRTEMPLKRSNIQHIDKINNQSVQQLSKRDNRQVSNNRKAKLTKRRVTINERKLGSYNQKLGYTHTFVTVVDRNGRQMLKSTKVSRRLLQKSNNKQKETKPKRGGRSPARRSVTIKQEEKLDTSKRQSPSRGKSRVLSIKRSVRKSEHQSEVLNADYIKSHFQELNIDVDKLCELSDSFLTEADKQISKILIDYQEAVMQQKRLQQKKRLQQQLLEPSNEVILDLGQSQPNPTQQPLENNQNNNQQQSNHASSKGKQSQLESQLEAIKNKKCKLISQLTQQHIQVEKVVEPDVNHHGIYALVKVTKKTAVLFGARYFLIPMIHLQFCNRKIIDEDIETIRRLVDEEERDNIGILNPTLSLMQTIQKEKREREGAKTKIG